MKQPVLAFLFIALLRGEEVTSEDAPALESVALYKPAPEHHHAYPYPGLQVVGDPGYGIQSGYEGYLVPIEEDDSGEWKITDILQFLPNTMLRTLGYWLFRTFVTVLSGAAMTIGLCTFTPVCTLTLLGFAFGRETTNRAYFTTDRLSSAAAFIRDAIEKYRKMQTEPEPDSYSTTQRTETGENENKQ